MTTLASDYLRHLPQIFRTETHGSGAFLGEFLKIFEALLSGRPDALVGGERVVGLEEAIAAFVEHLDPARTPVDDAAAGAPLDSEFLDYLASWVALTLDQNWPLAKKREWLRRIVPLYKRRGTRAGLLEYLRMFVGADVGLDETAEFIVAVNSTVALDTFVGGAAPYFFRVRIRYGVAEPLDIGTWENIISGTRAIVDLEKPAHTYYELDLRAAGFVIARRSTVAVDSLLGAIGA